MLSPALLIAVCLTVYLLVIAAFCQRKLHGVVWWRRLLSLLFPTSQLCLVLFALGAAAAYAAPSAPVAVIAVVGIACGPVDMLLFQGLRDAYFRAQAAGQVRELEDELTMQKFLRERSAHEGEEADRIGQRVREQLYAAEADLRARRAAEAGENLDRVINAAGGSRARYCAHPAIDALVRLKLADARELGVRFAAQLHVPLDLALPSAEICAVFSNLIDNALTACRLVAPDQRYVSVAARIWGRYFVVDVENSCASDDSARDIPAPAGAPAVKSSGKDCSLAASVACEKPETASSPHRANARRVANGEVPADAASASVPASPAVPNVHALHGWGRGIVNDIAERHDGQVSVQNERGRYHVRVILHTEGGDAL